MNDTLAKCTQVIIEEGDRTGEARSKKWKTESRLTISSIKA